MGTYPTTGVIGMGANGTGGYPTNGTAGNTGTGTDAKGGYPTNGTAGNTGTGTDAKGGYPTAGATGTTGTGTDAKGGYPTAGATGNTLTAGTTGTTGGGGMTGGGPGYPTAGTTGTTGPGGASGTTPPQPPTSGDGKQRLPSGNCVMSFEFWLRSCWTLADIVVGNTHFTATALRNLIESHHYYSDDATLLLVREVVAFQFNRALGATVPSNVAAAYDQAQAWLAPYVSSTEIKRVSHEKMAPHDLKGFDAVVDTLADFNEGELRGTPSCARSGCDRERPTLLWKHVPKRWNPYGC
jgi:hypothetical protein